MKLNIFLKNYMIKYIFKIYI